MKMSLLKTMELPKFKIIKYYLVDQNQHHSVSTGFQNLIILTMINKMIDYSFSRKMKLILAG